MTTARRFVERDHPRHPGGTEQGGRFRDKPDWAALTSGIVGQMTHTKPYAPGEWFDSGYRGPREWKDQVTQSLTQALVAQGFEDADAHRAAKLETASLPMPKRVIVNGQHRLAIFETDPFEVGIGDVLQLMDDLLAENSPEDPLTMAIVPPGMMALGPDAFGETVRGTGHIRLSSKAMVNSSILPPMGAGKMMASWENTPTWRYVLIHEWGHAIDDDRSRDRVKKFLFERHHDSLSEYGQGNIHEAYAEAFAEFILNPGSTNPAVHEYSRQFDWEPLQ